jgi:hypothetical protein
VKASPEVILRRLATLGLASERVYRTRRAAWGDRRSFAPAPSSGGSPIEVKTISKDGPTYTRLVLDAYDQRLISTSAASDYLGVKPRHFQNIRTELAHRQELIGSSNSQL